MKRDAPIYLKEIWENMEMAERFVEGVSYEDFERLVGFGVDFAKKKGIREQDVLEGD